MAKQRKKQDNKWIQKANLRKGAFTEWCKKRGYGGVTAKCIEEGLRSKNAHVRKMANLAKTFRKLARKRRKKK